MIQMVPLHDRRRLVQQLLVKYPISEENKNVWGAIINIMIIFFRGRRACLIESTNHAADFDRIWPDLTSLCDRLGLHIVLDPPVYSISRQTPDDEARLGKLLGTTGEYYNFRKPRVLMHIYAETRDHVRIELFTHVVVDATVIEKHARLVEHRARKWQRIWDQNVSTIPLDFHTKVSIDRGTQ